MKSQKIPGSTKNRTLKNKNSQYNDLSISLLNNRELQIIAINKYSSIIFRHKI